MIPWSLRNYVAYNELVLLTAHTSDYIGISLLSTIFKDSTKNESPKEMINRNYPTEEERELIKQGGNPKGRREVCYFGLLSSGAPFDVQLTISHIPMYYL